MALPKKKIESIKFKFVDLPENVWKVQLLPQKIPIPTYIFTHSTGGPFRYEKVQEFIKTYLEQASDYKDIVYFENALKAHDFGNKGVNFHRNGNYLEAIKWYGKALEFEPHSWICLYNQAFCHLQLENLEQGKACLQRAIQTLAVEPRNYALLGDILVQQKKYLQAFGAYHQFLRQARLTGAFTNVCFQLRYQLGLLEDKNPQIKMYHAWPFDSRCICGEKWDFPKKCINQEEDPHQFKDAQFPRATDWHLHENIECITCHIKIDGYSCDHCGRKYHWGLGTLKSYHPFDEIISIQQTYFDFGGEDKKIKSDIEAILQETAFALLEFRYQDALNSLYRASQIAFDEPIYHYKLVEILKLMGKETEGLKHYENILTSKPNSVMARYALALISPNPTRSTQIFQELILENPTFGPSYHAIGEILLEEGRSDESLDYLFRCMDIDPNWVPVYRSLAMLYQGMGNEPLSVHYRNYLHRIAPYFDDRHENSYLAFAGRLQNDKQYDRANMVLSSIAEIAKAAVANEEQKVHFELGFEPWLKVKKMNNFIQMGLDWMAKSLMGQVTKSIEDAGFTNDEGFLTDLRLNLVKTLIDEGLEEEAHEYLDKNHDKGDENQMDTVAVDWLKSYQHDRKIMRRVLSGDQTLSAREVAQFSVRVLAEIQSSEKNGSAIFIDGEGLLVAPTSCIDEDEDEVEILTYDGLWLSAKVICHCDKAPFSILKAPPLAEGVYFHVDLSLVPVLHHDKTVIVVGPQSDGDFIGIEAKIQQDFIDGQGVRYLILDRTISDESTGFLVLNDRGAVLGMSVYIEKGDPDLKTRLVIDSDEIARLANGINQDYAYLYRSEFCSSCGQRRQKNSKTCSCGQVNSLLDGDEKK